MRITAPKGELVLDFLFKQRAQDGALLEAQFYELNPHVRGTYFTVDTSVLLPPVQNGSNEKQITRSWD